MQCILLYFKIATPAGTVLTYPDLYACSQISLSYFYHNLVTHLFWCWLCGVCFHKLVENRLLLSFGTYLLWSGIRGEAGWVKGWYCRKWSPFKMGKAGEGGRGGISSPSSQLEIPTSPDRRFGSISCHSSYEFIFVFFFKTLTQENCYAPYGTHIL